MRPGSRPFGLDDGLDIDNLEETTQDQVDLYLTRMWRDRRPLYEVSANSVWLDHRPDFAKLHRRGARLFGRPQPANILMLSLANVHTYIHLAWEVGILNEFLVLQRLGVTKAQLMEVVMTAQISAGMRGLECVYRAVGVMLRDFQDKPTPAPFPAEWAPDTAAFRCGLDLSTPELSKSELAALTGWYTATIGEVPRSVSYSARAHPQFLKAYRAKWEGAFRGALPKQVMPYLMLRHNTVNGYRDGIREAALLGKAWGLSKAWIMHAIAGTAYYFSGLEVMSIVDDALGDQDL